ncbi:MAG: PASTA domain-containing protein [Clostridia bacterium]|nr:PASTA domain-containing protein [Clostridia bacterium]MBR0445554.1 PASTA domain-containing protein [Clostridia bacterium]
MADSSGRKIKQKLVILFIIMSVIFLALVFRLFQVQILKGDEYAERASRQQTRNDTLQAQRGKIMDSSNLVLAQSGTSYRVLINPRVISESERVRIAIEVSDVLGLDYDYVYERVCRTEKQQIVLKRQVEGETVDQLRALQLGSGISFSTDNKRYYPMGKLFSQLVGFTGTDGEGQTGIEASYDSYLAGKNGKMVTEVDRNKNELPYGESEYVAPTDGYDMKLTVDSVAQSYLEASVSDAHTINNAKQVTAMIMNPKTGELIATTSYPTFDLNAPPRSDVAALLEMSRNRCVTETYEPGSLFKLFVLAAGLDCGIIKPDQTFTCSGFEQYGLKRSYCRNQEKHGLQTIPQALANNCDCVFMQMAQQIGVNTLYDYIYRFGFGSETDSGIPGEDSGEILHRKYVRATELAEIACGRTLTVTPMQMLRAICAMVNGGTLYKPYVVDSITDTEGNIILKNESEAQTKAITAETSKQMCELMKSYIESESGSTASVANFTTGGLSGLSHKYDEDGTVSDSRFISSFVQFAPASNPDLVMYIMIDEPQVPASYAPYLCAPISSAVFRNLLRYYTILPDNGNTEIREVPNVVGSSVTDAIAALNKEHIRSVSIEAEADAIVIRQIPAPGTPVARASRVILYTSMTTYNSADVFVEEVEVPNLANMRRPEALDKLMEAGLILDFDESNCTGLINGQSVEPGTKVPVGTTITVTFNGYYAAAKVNSPVPASPTPEPAVTPEPDDTSGVTTIN